MRLALAAGLVAVVAASAWYYMRSQGRQTTDNAFIEGNIVQVSPRVGGPVVKVYVEDNQHVKRGDLLLEIDPQDYAIKVSEARGRQKEIQAREAGARSGLDLTSNVSSAQLLQAMAGSAAALDQVEVLKARLAVDDAGIGTAEAALDQAQARQTAAEAEARRASDDAARYRALYQKDEISRQLLDRAETEAKSLAANLAAVQKAVAAARSQVAQARGRPRGRSSQPGAGAQTGATGRRAPEGGAERPAAGGACGNRTSPPPERCASR